DEAAHLVLHELGRTSRVAAGDDRLSRRERLPRDEPIALLQRRKDDGPAARVMRDRLVVAHPPGERDARGNAQLEGQLLERGPLLPFTDDDAVQAGAVARGQRVYSG